MHSRAKAVFIAIYLPLILVIPAYGVFQLLWRGWDLTWAGAVLTTLPVLVLVGRAVIYHNVPRTSRHLPGITALTLLGSAGAVYGFFSAATPQLLPLALAAAGFLGYLLYDFWYSYFGRKLSPLLAVGNPLPEFSVRDLSGNPVHSGQLLGQPALVMFYRGNWCPLCISQVAEIAGRYRDLIERGVQVELISPQPPDLTRRVAEKYQVPFNFRVDPDCAAARQLGIAAEQGVPAMNTSRYGHDTVLPTVIITDAEGRIIFTDQTDNYRVRPEPDVFLRALAAHGL